MLLVMTGKSQYVRSQVKLRNEDGKVSKKKAGTNVQAFFYTYAFNGLKIQLNCKHIIPIKILRIAVSVIKDKQDIA